MRAIWLVAVVLLTTELRAQPPAVTPGTAALLVNRTDEEYRPALQRAIADADPLVRAVAARVAAVRRQADMVPALEKALEVESDATAKTEQTRAVRLIRNSAGAMAPAAPDVIRTMPQIARGVLASVMAAHGCKPSKYGSYGMARVTFDAAGATRTEVDPSELPRDCKPVLSTMARLVMAEDVQASAGSAVLLVLPVDEDFISCSSEPALETLPQGAVRPVKTRDVKPQYPAGALRDRSQGSVVLRALVTGAGCVSDVQVMKGLDVRLDFAALRAVAGWRFKPAIVDGKPVQFQLLCTVSFSVR